MGWERERERERHREMEWQRKVQKCRARGKGNSRGKETDRGFRKREITQQGRDRGTHKREPRGRPRVLREGSGGRRREMETSPWRRDSFGLTQKKTTSWLNSTYTHTIGSRLSLHVCQSMRRIFAHCMQIVPDFEVTQEQTIQICVCIKNVRSKILWDAKVGGSCKKQRLPCVTISGCWYVPLFMC